MKNTSFIAIVDEASACAAALLNRLSLMGHQAALFTNVSEVLTALGNGQRFDALLLATHDEKARTSLGAACGVLRMPALLLNSQGRWEAWLPESGFPSEGCFSTSPKLVTTTYASLDLQIGVLLHQKARLPIEGTDFHDEALVFGDYSFMTDNRTVMHEEKAVALQPRQFAFAKALFQNTGKVLARDWLWRTLWIGTHAREGARALDVCAANLRRRLSLRHENGYVLRAIYGRGYQLLNVAGFSETRKDEPRGDADQDALAALAPPPRSEPALDAAASGAATGLPGPD